MLVDEQLANQWLPYVGYYRLSAYWYPAREVDSDGKRLDTFQSGTTFTDVVGLYEADRKLRTLIHDGIERIEIAMRAQLTDLLCLTPENNPLAHLEADRFRPSFDHLDWLWSIYGRLKRSAKRSESVKHYRENYGGKYPLWVAAESMDFSDMSKLYAGLTSSEQFKIAENLGFAFNLGNLADNQKEKVRKRHPWANWLEQLSVIRNTCAHHGRLWNRHFTPATTTAFRTVDKFTALPEGQSERIFGTLVVMANVLREVSPGTTWPDKAIDLLANHFLTNPLVEAASMGIPGNWDQQSL